MSQHTSPPSIANELAPTASRRSATGRYDVIMVLFLAAGAALYILTAASVESFGSDTTTYYELGRSLWHEHRYWFNFEPHTFYPPGYPLLLGSLMSVLGESFTTLLRAGILVYFVGLVGLYYYVRMQRGPSTALAVVILVAISGTFYFSATVGLHSEGSYLTASVYALLFFEVGNNTTKRWLRILSIVAVALLASYLFLVRTIGVTLVAALVFWPIWHARGKPVKALAGWIPAVATPVVVLALWVSWTGLKKADNANDDYRDSYVLQTLKENPHQIDSPNITLKTLTARTLRMLFARAENATRMVFNLPTLTRWLVFPAAALFFVVVAIGLATSIRRLGNLCDFYVLAYMGVLVLYPYDEGKRYLVPMHPFLILYAIYGFEVIAGVVKSAAASVKTRLITQLTGSMLGAAMPVFFVAIVTAGLFDVAALADANLNPAPSTFTNATTVKVSRWIVQNTQEDDVIMDEEAQIMHRLTRRRTIRFPLSSDFNFLRKRIIANRVSFIVVLNEKRYEYYNPSIMRRFARLRERDPGLFAPAYAFEEGTVYRVAQERAH